MPTSHGNRASAPWSMMRAWAAAVSPGTGIRNVAVLARFVRKMLM